MYSMLVSYGRAMGAVPISMKEISYRFLLNQHWACGLS